MADQRTFVLIGNFTDNITPALRNINDQVSALRRNLAQIGGRSSRSVARDLGRFSASAQTLNDTLRIQNQVLRSTLEPMRQYRREVGRTIGALTRLNSVGGNAIGIERTNRALSNQIRLLDQLNSRRGRGGMPPVGPRGGGGRGGGGGGMGRGRGRGGRENVLSDVVSGSLISNAIVGAFQTGAHIIHQGISAALGAFAERAQDQLEDVAAAGGIFSAAKYSKGTGLPATFQGAMELQDKINKDMARIAANLPGTTHDYVENSRRLVDTTAKIMASDLQAFTKMAKDLTGKTTMTSTEAFQAVNVEISKATTLLEKINPSKTVVPMTQLVEDMMKDEKVSIGALRRYVAFRRGTTFEAALTRNLEELNKTGAGTADRMKSIIKVLREAVPAEMITAFNISVAGVVEGFKSAFLDPDVGLFGLSRTLSKKVLKFNMETGKPIVDEFGRQVTDTTNFFKMFSEIFGILGNLLNTAILPGLAALYSPFQGIADTLTNLRTYAFKVYENQQAYTKYFEELANKAGMSKEDFRVYEKGGVSVLLDILESYKMITPEKYTSIVQKMEASGTPEQIENTMKGIYRDIIPSILKSPFFKDIGKNLGAALAEVLKEIAKIMKALLSGDYGANEFVKAFTDAGGMDAINAIIMYAAEMIGKVLRQMIDFYVGSFLRSIKEGNFGAAAVLGLGGLLLLSPLFGFLGSLGPLLAPLGSFALPVVAIAGIIIFQDQLMSLGETLKGFGDSLTTSQDWLVSGLGIFVSGLGSLIKGVVGFVAGIWDILVGMFSGDKKKVIEGFKRVGKGLMDLIEGLVKAIAGAAVGWAGWQVKIKNAIQTLWSAIWDMITGAKDDVPKGKPKPPKKGSPAFGPSPGNPRGFVLPADSSPANGIYGAARGNFGDAVASEMRRKPAGSHLLVANSSETVIPAAGGYGMGDFIRTMYSGFVSINSSLKDSNKNLGEINRTLINNQMQTNNRLAKLEVKFSTPSMGGLGGAMGGGGVDSFTPIAQRFGLQLTSGYRPGDPGWHGANRARDFSNGTGPTPQMLSFARYLASTYGRNLRELIYTPLGFGIKNGAMVPPYAQASHYNHVHVAYARGFPGTPFTSASEAMQYEKAMTPGSVKVRSATVNSGESLGTTTLNGGLNITIHAGATNDPKQLADRVGKELYAQIKELQSASIFS